MMIYAMAMTLDPVLLKSHYLLRADVHKTKSFPFLRHIDHLKSIGRETISLKVQILQNRFHTTLMYLYLMV